MQGDAKSCDNYQGILLLFVEAAKVYEALENRIRDTIELHLFQFIHSF